MKKCRKFFLLLALSMVMMCGNVSLVFGADANFSHRTYDFVYPTGSAFTENLDSFDWSNWMKSTWTFGVNDTLFQEPNVVFVDGKMKLNLEEVSPAVVCGNNNGACNYKGGHYQSNNTYGYGTYEVRMKAAPVTGVVTSFFLFSDEELNAGRWAEIDFEIIKDNELQMTNWDAPGKQYHTTKTYAELGKDLSADYHNYKIEYFPNVIRWYVDDVLVGETTKHIPTSQSMKVMFNAWAPVTGGTRDWAGGDIPSETVFPVVAEYDYVAFAPYTGGTAQNVIQFFDTSTSYNTAWEWDFNNDGIVDSTDQHPLYTYLESGTYTVKLKVTDNLGEDTKVMTDYILVGGIPASDMTPDQFIFTDITNAELNTDYVSNQIVVLGIDASTAISVINGSYRVNGGSWVTTNGTVNNGDVVEVKITSSSSYNTLVSSTLNIGGVTDVFGVRTKIFIADTTPNQFVFNDVVGANLSTYYISNTIVVSGINASATVSILNGEYRINGGYWRKTGGTVNLGDTVELRVKTPRRYLYTISATLNIGGVVDTYSVTTKNR